MASLVCEHTHKKTRRNIQTWASSVGEGRRLPRDLRCNRRSVFWRQTIFKWGSDATRLLQQVLAGKLPAVSLSATRERMLKEALEQIQSGNVKQHQSVETLIGESLYARHRLFFGAPNGFTSTDVFQCPQHNYMLLPPGVRYWSWK